MKTLIVNEKFNNKKLLAFLIREFPNTAQSIFYKSLRKKDIRINGIKTSENTLLHTGDKIELYILDKYLYPEMPELPISYEDENILVVNKPKGIEVTRQKFSRGNLTKKI